MVSGVSESSNHGASQQNTNTNLNSNKSHLKQKHPRNSAVYPFIEKVVDVVVGTFVVLQVNLTSTSILFHLFVDYYWGF